MRRWEFCVWVGNGAERREGKKLHLAANEALWGSGVLISHVCFLRPLWVGSTIVFLAKARPSFSGSGPFIYRLTGSGLLFFFSLSLVWEAKYKHGLPLGQHRWQRGLRDKRGVFHLSSLPPRTKRTGCRTFLHLFCVYGVCACSVNATDYSALYRHYILHYLLQWKCCYSKIFLMLQRKCQQQIVSYIKWLFVRCSSSMSLFFLKSGSTQHLSNDNMQWCNEKKGLLSIQIRCDYLKERICWKVKGGSQHVHNVNKDF